MNQALKSFQSNLDNLKLPSSLFKTTVKDIEKIQGNLRAFQALTEKTSFSTSEINQVLKLYEQIGNEIKILGINFKNISKTDLQNLMPPEALSRFQKLNQVLGEIQTQLNFKSTIPGQLKELGIQAKEAGDGVKKLKSELDSLNKQKNTIINNQLANKSEQQRIKDEIRLLEKQNKAFVESRAKNPQKIQNNKSQLEKLKAEYRKLEIDIAALEKQLSSASSRNTIEATKRQQSLEKKKIDLVTKQKEIDNLQKEQRSLVNQKDPLSTKVYQDREKQINKLRESLIALQQKEKEIKADENTNKESITLKTKEYNKQVEAVEKLNKQIQQLNSSSTDSSKVEEIRKSLSELLQLDIKQVPQDLEELQKITSNLSAEELDKVTHTIKSLETNVQELGKAYEGTEEKAKSFQAESDALTNSEREVSALKTRIQYFFGLQNAILLARRALQSVYNTIKELDKAMTETAVVTKFTVADMWAQLPDYTKRASELGVTTQQAYEAATLYYQQGLKTNEVTALSTETLKMARIAGLEAAEATDRMTNALRGFNMEINETNAQRVDDVYSQLAAITASNVDEISTAMTKVASLAHSANMEFENTAAFLAQIIETTRESAETAGTALKTVVARFSEVKNLYSKNQLIGTDEEGDEIDVNRVSVALRSAGIDLNKYFTGMIGLDDIFLELASKWDQLDTIQQRYIATQAAGSRQQSRFIALMSDYNRLQELTTAAYNSEGASAKQFEKTQASLQSKLAKLKNAWDTFILGITNSDLIKTGIDLLTKILTVVNELTDGFGLLTKGVGGFISSLLKIGVLVSGLSGGSALAAGGIGFLGKIMGLKDAEGFMGGMRRAVWGKDAAKQGFGETLGQAFLGRYKNLFGRAKTGIQSFKQKHAASVYEDLIIPGSWGNNGQWIPERVVKQGSIKTTQAVPKTMFGALGNAFKETKAGTALNKKLASIKGLEGVFTGAAGGAATLGVAIAGVGAALATAYVIWNKFSPSQQLKRAKQVADAANQQAQNIRKQADNLSKVNTLLKEKNELLKQNLAIEERSTVIQEKNNYINQLIKENKQLAQYVSTTTDNLTGQLVYSIDEQILNEQEKILKIATDRANAIASFAQSGVNYREYRKAENESKYAKEVLQYNSELTKNQRNEWEITQRQQDINANSAASLLLLNTKTGYNAILSELYSGDMLNTLSSVMARGFDAEAYSKQIESGAFWNWAKSKQELKDEYQAYYGTEVPENMKIADLQRAVAAGAAYSQREAEDRTKAAKIQAGLTELQSENESAYKILVDLLNNGGKNLTTQQVNLLTRNDNLQELIGTELYEALGENVTKWLEGVIPDINFDSITEKFSKQFSDDYTKELNDIYKELQDSFDLTFGQASGFADIFTELGSVASTEDVQKFADFVSSAIEAAPNDKKQSIINLLSSLNVKDANSIKTTFYRLNELGTDFSDLGNSVDDAIINFIKLNKVISQISLEDIKKELTDTVTFIKELKGRDKDQKTFTEDQYKQLILAGANSSDFVFTGLSGEEYVYIGGELNTIIDILNNSLQAQLETNRTLIENRLEISNPFFKNEETGNQLLSEMQLALTNEKVSDELLAKLQENEVFRNYAGIEEGQSVTDKYTDVGLLNKLGSFVNILNSWKTDQDTFSQLNNTYSVASNINRDVGDIYSDKTLNDEQRNQIYEAKFAIDKDAVEVYDEIYESLGKINGLEGDREQIAKRLSLEYSKQAKEIDKLNDVINNNKEGLEAGDHGSLVKVAKQVQETYGLNDLEKTMQLVSENTDLFLTMSEDAETYRQVLALVFEEWRNGFIETNGLTEKEIGYLDSFTQQILDIPDIDVAAQLDPTPFAEQLAGMFDNVEDFENFLDSLGWVIDWSAYSADAEHTLETLLSGEMHLKRMSGGGSHGYSGGSGSKGGGGGSSKDTDWKNEFDWLYNLLEDIAETERLQAKLQSEYNRALEDPNTGGQKLVDIVKQQLEVLGTKLAQNKLLFAKRQEELQGYMSDKGAYSDYVKYNWEDRTIEIDWDKINSLEKTDKEKYDKIKEIADDAEKIQDEMDKAEDEVRSTEDEIRSFKNIWRQEYIDFEKEVKQAIINSYQKVIDQYSDLNDTLSSTNDAILNSLQEQVNLSRQIRDNTETEEDINEKEARLAYLRRDTTGKNKLEILSLEKELNDTRQNYEDTLVDQAIDRLSDDNAKAQEQREHQIDIMTQQLQTAEENGAFNEKAIQLINDAMDPKGGLLKNTQLEALMQSNENFTAMSKAEAEAWSEEFSKKFNVAAAYLLGGEEFKETMESIEESAKYTAANVGNYTSGVNYSGSGGDSDGGQNTRDVIPSPQTPPKGWKVFYKNPETGTTTQLLNGEIFNSEYQAKKAIQDEISKLTKKVQDYSLDPTVGLACLKKINWLKQALVVPQYKSGGLASFTGPAWLDGTTSKPEYILNSDQTAAFLKLAEVLPSLMSNPTNISSKNEGDIYLDISINVDEISGDYDVEKIADKVKDLIYNASSYRNVNTINLIR